MLESVLEAVIGALKKGGLEAGGEFPFESRRLTGPWICVYAGDCRSLDSGFGGYLGLKARDDGSQTELYGRRLELELLFDVYAPLKAGGSELCRRTADKLRGLTETFPQGLRILELSGGRMTAEEGMGAYRCSFRASCAALFLAEAYGDEGEFSDFVLKGVVDGVNN